MNYYYLHKRTKGLIHKPDEVVSSPNHQFYTECFIEKLWAYEDNDTEKLQQIFNEAQKLGAQQGDLWHMRCLHNLKGAVTDYEKELEEEIVKLKAEIEAYIKWNNYAKGQR